MRQKTAALGLAVILLLVLGGCTGQTEKMSWILELNLSAAQTMTTTDSHGGFHGDGLLLVELSFSPEDGADLEEQILGRGDLWNPGPFDSYLGRILYEGGPAQEGNWPRSPEHGYWFFLDRQEDQEKPIGQRFSYNYTAALYDGDTCTLYYLEFDT